MEAITYYHREGVDYGALALTVRQLATVEAALAFALDRDPVVGAEAYDIRDEVMAGIQRLEERGGHAVLP